MKSVADLANSLKKPFDRKHVVVGIGVTVVVVAGIQIVSFRLCDLSTMLEKAFDVLAE
jgi:hypothetical protein